MLALVVLVGEIRAGPVLGGDKPQPQRAKAIAEVRLVQHFRPGEHGVAREQRVDMAAGVDGDDLRRVGEAVEGSERASEIATPP